LANLSPEQATFHYITAGFDEMRATSWFTYYFLKKHENFY
jgi:hypothetical protein